MMRIERRRSTFAQSSCCQNLAGSNFSSGNHAFIQAIHNLYLIELKIYIMN